MNTQPEALRLAGELEDAGKPTFITDAAAVELRRLYAENVALRQAIEQAEQAQPVAHTLNCVCGATWDIKADGSEEIVNAPDSAPPQRKQYVATIDISPERVDKTQKHRQDVSQRKPLTHPQIHELDWPDGVAFEDILLFARAIEAAHGIKE
jgi:hypothetical protein